MKSGVKHYEIGDLVLIPKKAIRDYVLMSPGKETETLGMIIDYGNRWDRSKQKSIQMCKVEFIGGETNADYEWFDSERLTSAT